jgi:hypothetical protein
MNWNELWRLPLGCTMIGCGGLIVGFCLLVLWAMVSSLF